MVSPINKIGAVMIDIKKFIKRLHEFDPKLYFANNEDVVHKIMTCEPKECLKLGISMDDVLQIYRQSIAHLVQNSASREICRSIVNGLQEIKASRAEADFI